MKPSKHKKNTEILYCTGYYTAKAFMTLKSSLKFKVHPTAFKLQVPSVSFYNERRSVESFSLLEFIIQHSFKNSTCM